MKQFDLSAPIKISERVGDLEAYAQKLLQSAYNYCIKNDERIIGFITFYANHADTAHLTIIAVEEKYKGCGIGARLLEHAITISKEQGMKRMRLEVHKQNSTAIFFIRRIIL